MNTCIIGRTFEEAGELESRRLRGAPGGCTYGNRGRGGEDEGRMSTDLNAALSSNKVFTKNAEFSSPLSVGLDESMLLEG